MTIDHATFYTVLAVTILALSQAGCFAWLAYIQPRSRTFHGILSAVALVAGLVGASILPEAFAQLA